MINRLDINAQVKILGSVENNKIVDLMSEYRGFILCSYPETFGIVYIEALSAGLPIIYSKDAGIDGFFDDMEIGVAVHYNNINEICSAINEVNINPVKFRESVRKLLENDCLSQFSADSVKQKYNSIYNKAGVKE